MNRITYRAALEIISHEGIVRQAYKDSKGVLTWGIGVTDASGHNVKRYLGKPQPMEKVLEVFIWLLETKCLPAVIEAFHGYELQEHELAAALSFHYNTGGIKRALWVRTFMAGHRDSARVLFMSWKRPASIIPRREKERDLFFDGKWSATGFATEYTRLTRKGTVDWRSAKRVDIRKPLKRAMRKRGLPTKVKRNARPRWLRWIERLRWNR